MLYRYIIEDLRKWKERKHNPLIVYGLKRIGKTTIVKQFAKENYENVIYLDLRLNKDIHSVFDGNFDVNQMVLSITSKIPNIKIEPHKILFIFDEIQDCPNARSSLKYWDLDGRYDVIATGSFLGVKGFRTIYPRGIPVGYEEKMIMYPLTFKEFLINIGMNSDVLNYVEDCLKRQIKVNDSVHESMMSLFKQYLIVGGMPEAVNSFLYNYNINDVRSIQNKIINSIKDDFGRYISKNGEEKINESIKNKSEACLNSLPNQLAKEYKKFQFSLVDIKGKSVDKVEGVEYLCDLGLAIKAYNLRELAFPLNGNKKENEYKLFYGDTGLLMSQLDFNSANLVLNGEFGAYKGALIENIFATQLIANGYNLYYYHASSGSPEIDFVISYKDQINLIELKGGNNKATSMNFVLDNPKRFGKHKGIKIANANIGKSDKYLTVPLYALGFINKEIFDLILKPVSISLKNALPSRQSNN